jgi:hypothetical protein
LKSPLSSEDARLLFALLDAADDDGLLRGFAGEARWREVKGRGPTLRYQQEGNLFWELLDELDRAGKLDRTWMHERWRTLKTRTTGAIALPR